MQWFVMVRSSARGWRSYNEGQPYYSLDVAKRAAHQAASGDAYAVVHEGDRRGPIKYVACQEG